MASIRKRGNSYLIVVSMGYDYEGKRIKPVQKTVKPPIGLTKKQIEKYVNEQAVLFERQAKNEPQITQKSITFANYTQHWLEEIAPNKFAVSTLVRAKQNMDRILPHIGKYKLKDLKPDIFKNYYTLMRKDKHKKTGKPISENTVEGLHSTICSILSDAVDEGYLTHNPAWRAYRYSGRKAEKVIADRALVQKLIAALENESIKYELYFKLIIATGMRRGECCGLKWSDINYAERKIHIQRNVVKVPHHEIFVKDTKTSAGDRYVYFSIELESLLLEFYDYCKEKLKKYENREIANDDYIFMRDEMDEPTPMTPNTFTWRFKLILKKNNMPKELNVHSLRHSNASLLIASGVDVTTVAGLLGHAQPSTTLDIYSHAFDDNKRRAHEGLQEELEL